MDIKQRIQELSLDDKAKLYFMGLVRKGEIDTLPENPKAAYIKMVMDKADPSTMHDDPGDIRIDHDYYLEESHTDAENRQLKKISKALDKASKMHKDQSKKIKKIVKEEDVTSLKEKLKNIEEGKPGLWDNIRAKRASGKKMSSKGSKAYKSAVKAGNKINREDS